MSRPNISIPTEFATNGTKTDFSASKISDGFDRLNPDVLAGDNLNKFIDDTYKGLNGVLELYDGCVLYDANNTYSNTSIVFNIDSNGKTRIYHSLVNNNTGNALTDTTKWKEDTLFLNQNQTSNCILEMPSTSPSYSGLTVTIPAGLKVLIPNGRNVDGTLNNIEYTTTSNSTYTISGAGNWLIFMQPNGVLWLIPKQHINNRAGYVYFDFKNNTWYDTYNVQQRADTMCLIGECISNSSQITSFAIYNGLRLLNWNDKRNIVNWSQVDYSSAISLTLGGTNPYTYTASKNGWFCLRAKLVTAGASLNISLGNEQIPFANSRTTTAGNQVSYVSAPCCAGGQVSIGWGGTLDSSDYTFYFVPLMAEENYI